MNTNLVLVPSENLGVVVMTNTFNSFMVAIANRVLDAYLGLGDRQWGDVRTGSVLRAQYASAQARRDSIHEARVAGHAAEHPASRTPARTTTSLPRRDGPRRGRRPGTPVLG
jgi:hypothetical protein